MPTPARANIHSSLLAREERTEKRLLDLREVCHIVGVVPTTIYKLMRGGRFPQSIKVGSATRWSAREVNAWIDARLAERKAARS